MSVSICIGPKNVLLQPYWTGFTFLSVVFWADREGQSFLAHTTPQKSHSEYFRDMTIRPLLTLIAMERKMPTFVPIVNTCLCCCVSGSKLCYRILRSQFGIHWWFKITILEKWFTVYERRFQLTLQGFFSRGKSAWACTPKGCQEGYRRRQREEKWWRALSCRSQAEVQDNMHQETPS